MRQTCMHLDQEAALQCKSCWDKSPACLKGRAQASWLRMCHAMDVHNHSRLVGRTFPAAARRCSGHRVAQQPGRRVRRFLCFHRCRVRLPPQRLRSQRQQCIRRHAASSRWLHRSCQHARAAVHGNARTCQASAPARLPCLTVWWRQLPWPLLLRVPLHPLLPLPARLCNTRIRTSHREAASTACVRLPLHVIRAACSMRQEQSAPARPPSAGTLASRCAYRPAAAW
jgi:hypothetical protein